MAISFKSAHKRAFWGALAFSLGTEYLVVFLIYWLASNGNSYSWGWAALTVAGIQLFLLSYGLLTFARRAAWYHLFEKDVRANAFAGEFARLNFPRAEGFYVDGDDYLRQVALSPATSPEGALFAGSLLGALEAHRLNGPRTEAFFLALSIEQAIRLALPTDMSE